MAYDEGLAQRIRESFADRTDFSEKRMFGGLAFMVRGHMTVGIIGDELMVRVGSDAYEASLKRAHARPMDFTGRPSKTMVYVGTDAFEEDRDLESWIGLALAHNETQPAKTASAKKATPKKTPAKKTLAKKTPAKKAPAKKTPAKKAGPKPAPAKKPAPKKAAPKRPGPKQKVATKAPAKRAGPKKASARR